MKNALVDVVIIGAGHAGLSLSYYLKQYGLRHVVLERGVIGESWRNQRWNSFRLNSSNKINVLPGYEVAQAAPDSFPSAGEFADLLKTFVIKHELPVFE